MMSMEYVERTCTFSLLANFPLLVVIRMTPPKACVPYNAAAEAPFSTEMLSISLGLISFRRDSWLEPPLSLLPRTSLLIGIPSRMMSGWLLRVMVDIPRI